MSARPCKKCGMAIEFIENAATGKTIPAQKIRTVYQGVIQQGSGDWKLEKVELEEAEAYYVSHFETCPHAASFSRKAPEGSSAPGRRWEP